MTDKMIVYVTCADRQEAMTIARTVVEERLAACANVMGDITSVYWWEGVQTGQEVNMILKTTAALVDALTRRVVELHSYDCPCVVAVPIAAGHPEFLKWIADETR